MTAKRNILIIHTDQHRYDCLGATGNADIRTPNIDRLASEGVVFENSFCPYPVCTPSRYSFLTGLYAHQHRGIFNQSTLAAGIPTFPRVFREHGYRTAAVGKMHFTPTYLDVGFDYMQLAEQHGAGRFEDDYHAWLMAEGQHDYCDLIDQVAEYRPLASADYWQSYGALPSNLDEKYHSTTWIGDQSCAELDQWGDSGNLLMVGFIKPHHPFDPPRPWAEMYDPAQLAVLPGWTDTPLHNDDARGYFDFSDLSLEKLRQVMAYYYATISQIDFQVGRIIAKLESQGLYDKTLIVFTSDHGDYLGYQHRLLKGYRMLEPLVRVPLIIKGLEPSIGRERDTRLVNNVDIAPTLLSAAGLPLPATMRGLDLTDPEQAADYVFAQSESGYMIRSQHEKLLLSQEADPLFFDLGRDPLEQTNLYAAPHCQERIQEMTNDLLSWMLFDSVPPSCRDEQAATVRPKVSPNKLRAYFRQKMTSS